MTATTIPALLADAAARAGERVAVVDGDVELRYTDLRDEATTFAAALVAAGIGAGDRVSIWAPNSARWIIGVFGLWQAGAVLVPINTRFKGAEAADILARSHARALVTVTDFLGADPVAMVQGSGVELPDLETVVIIDGPVPDGTTAWADFVAGRRCRGAPRSSGEPRRYGKTTHPTSCSPPAPPVCRRVSCRRKAARCAWRPTGWP